MVRDSKSRVRPWVMVFHFQSDKDQTELALQRGPEKSAEAIRCIDLRSGQSHGALAIFTNGY